MRLALCADIHANLEALQAVLQDADHRSVDCIVCLGDIVGYNADPAACIELLRRAGSICVAGNHDLAVSGRISTKDFAYTASRAIAWTRRRLHTEALDFLTRLPLEVSVPGHIVAVHASLHREPGQDMIRLDNDERRLRTFQALAEHASGIRICAFGHTHQLGLFELYGGAVRHVQEGEVALRDEALYLVNPGTVGQPRDDDRRATYIVLDAESRYLTVHRVEYDFSAAAAKTRRAGLAPPSTYLPPALRKLLWSVRYGRRPKQGRA